MTLRSTGILVALVVLAASPLDSQLIPRGPEFRVNEAALHAKEAPALALDGSGRLLAAWAGPTDHEFDDDNDLLVRLFERNGEPAGPETVLPAAGKLKDHPVLLALPSGGFALAWENVTPPAQVLPPPPGVGDPETLSLRILDAAGAPVGGEIRIDKDGGQALGVRLALLPSGQIVATWVEMGGQLMARRFEPNGQPAGEEILLALRDATVPGVLENDALRGLQDGSFLTTWLFDPAASAPRRTGWRFTAAGEPAGAPFPLDDGVVALGSDGRFAVVWSEISGGTPPGPDFDIWMDLYNAGGRLVSSTLIASTKDHEIVQAAAMDEAGNILVVWSNEAPGEDLSVDADLTASLFDRNGTELGPAFAVASDAMGDQLGARIAEKNGEWVISWITREPGSTGGGNLFARRFASCITGGSTLCLGGRFRAQVTWRAPGIGTGTGAGQAVPLTDDTGAFWFFSPENPELVVKALDGRTFNHHYWVFYGALSNVEYDLTVTDAITGARRVYHNPAGTMASRADTRAFQEPGPPPAAAAAFLQEPQSAALSEEPICPPGTGFCCPPLPGVPCLHGGRFSVDVEWRIPSTGQLGFGQEVSLTNDSAYVWFFDRDNIELLIKILDGRGVNGKYWVFYGALSDVEYTIRVTDHLTGKVKTYHNPAGTMASRADTSAF